MFHFLTQILASQNFSATNAWFMTICFALAACAVDENQHSDEIRDTGSQIEAHLAYGEFAKAIELVDELPANTADKYLSRIATAQAKSGNQLAAAASIDRISDDRIRYRVLFQRGLGPAGFNNAGGPFNNGPVVNNNSGTTTQTGLQGGITEADFQPLINLIKSAISPDSWDDVNGDGTIQAYPTGVFVDASGTLQKLKIDSKRNLKELARKSQLSRHQTGQDVGVESPLRMVSLNRLERRAQILAAQGRSLSPEMLNLAGIYHVKYLMYHPETGDIVIAGPAGPWQIDSDGHQVNAKTGKPVVQLEDLVACLRNAQLAPLGNHGKFGCAITPKKQNLAAAKQYLATSKLKGKAWRQGLRDTLGKQEISVFGMDPATHAGRVLVEADYRMKLVAMGIEPSVPEIPSYMQRIQVGADGQVSPMDVVRLWFTMNYDEVIADADRHVFQLRGTGVRVLSENEFINDDGERIHTGQADGPTAGFARDFTRHFEAISTRYPIYWRLKNLFDMAIVAAIIRGQQLDQQAQWHMTYFGNQPEFVDHSYRLATAPVPREVESVMNHRTITVRKPTSTIKHTLIGVSGGIVFDAQSVLRNKARIAGEQEEFSDLNLEMVSDESDVWWWD